MDKRLERAGDAALEAIGDKEPCLGEALARIERATPALYRSIRNTMARRFVRVLEEGDD